MTDIRRYLEEGEQAGQIYTLKIPREAFGRRQGHSGGHGLGISLDFREFREYQPGDDLRRIDWGAYGRSDRLMVKLFREEVEPHADILMDTSCSMNLEGTGKAHAALKIAALTATAARNAGCTCRVWMTAQGCVPVENGTDRASLWQGIEFASVRPLSDEIAFLPPLWRPQGIRILISDLLFPGNPQGIVSRIADRAAAVSVIQILAEADRNPHVRGNLRVRDSETGETADLLFDENAHKNYLTALENHQRNWSQTCRRMGVSLTIFTAEELIGNREPTELEKCGLLTRM
ncbi:MAG: DUF58 domain-containing protein [Desulfobacterales bacterium]